MTTTTDPNMPATAMSSCVRTALPFACASVEGAIRQAEAFRTSATGRYAAPPRTAPTTTRPPLTTHARPKPRLVFAARLNTHLTLPGHALHPRSTPRLVFAAA
jgi:hypothetical protein